MKFVKGMLVGSFVSASLVIAYTETLGKDKKKFMKKCGMTAPHFSAVKG